MSHLRVDSALLGRRGHRLGVWTASAWILLVSGGGCGALSSPPRPILAVDQSGADAPVEAAQFPGSSPQTCFPVGQEAQEGSHGEERSPAEWALPCDDGATTPGILPSLPLVR